MNDHLIEGTEIPTWKVVNLWLQGTPIRSIEVLLKISLNQIAAAMDFYYSHPIQIGNQIRKNNQYE